MSALYVCERFVEVGVSRRGTAKVMECLVGDAELAWLEGQ